jgi:hypothetical protein
VPFGFSYVHLEDLEKKAGVLPREG